MTDKIYDNFIKLHSVYETKSLNILLRELRKLFKSINFNNLSFDARISQQVIELNLNKEQFEKVLYKVHYTIGTQYGNTVTRDLRKEFPVEQKKWNPLPFFNEAFQRFLLNFYRNEGGEYITLLSRTMAETVTQEIVNGTYENETLQQMRDRIFKTVNNPNFYKWQALRIARTETSFAMNSAKYVSGDVSGVVMEKVWIGRNDGRERQTHLANNGKLLSKDQLFRVGDSEMLYPGDRSHGASAKEVIQCRCTIGWQAKRDENGRLIFTD